MRQIKQLSIFLLGIIILASCTDVVEIEAPPTQEGINIYGRITDTLGTTVTVSLTSPYFEDGDVSYVNDASVFLYEDDTLIGELNSQDDNGVYHLDYNGKIGSSYEIEVTIPGTYNLPTSWRSKPETMSRIFTEDSMNVRYLDRTTNPSVFDEGYYALVYFKEPDGVGDFYRFRRWLNDSLFTQEFFFWDDEFIDGIVFGEDISGFNIYGPIDEGDSVGVEMGSISKEYSEYLSIVSEQVFQVGSPFDPPPSPIVGNIFNKDDPADFGFGYFYTSALNFSGVTRNP